MTLTLTVRCLAGCGVLATGSTDEQPARRYNADWTRWSELDSVAGKHPHPTVVTATPRRTGA